MHPLEGTHVIGVATSSMVRCGLRDLSQRRQLMARVRRLLDALDD
jgi:hypothetical protein